MSIYYTAQSRRRADIQFLENRSHNEQPVTLSTEQAPSSILIFPSPPSAPASSSSDPGTPGSMSAISVPTSFSISRFEGSSIRSSPGERLADMTTWEDLDQNPELQEEDTFEWAVDSLSSEHDWNQALPISSFTQSLLFSAPPRAHRFTMRTRPLQTPHVPSTSSLRLRLAARSRSRSPSKPSPPYQSPQTLFHLPFLSFLRHLFYIDSSTILLLTRPSTSPVLFSAAPHSLFSAEDGEINPERPDPIQSLLRPASETSMIKKGLDAACFAGAMPFSGIYNVFELVVESSGKAWREVFSGPPITRSRNLNVPT